MAPAHNAFFTMTAAAAPVNSGMLGPLATVPAGPAYVSVPAGAGAGAGATSVGTVPLYTGAGAGARAGIGTGAGAGVVALYTR